MAGLNILQWNANGINSHGSELKALLQNGYIHPHIIFIQESKLINKHKFNLPGYISLRKDRPGCTNINRGGGLITCIKNGIEFKETDFKLEGAEIQTMEIHMNNTKINMANIYIPPKAKVNRDNLNNLTTFMGDCAFICGDFNAHSSLWEEKIVTNANGKTVEDWTENNNLIILNQGQPTWHCLDSNKYSTVDLSIITPNLINQSNWQVFEDSWGSDHFPILIQLHNTTVHIQEPYTAKKWNFNKANWDMFKTLCGSLIKEDTITEDIDNSNETFINKLIQAAEQTIPYYPTKQYKTKSPWWNEDIIKARQVRKRTLKKARKNPNLIPKAKAARNKVGDVIKQAKLTSWKKFSTEINYKTSSTQAWKKINRIRGKHKKLTIPHIENCNNNSEKAETFAKHYADISSDNNFSDDFKRNKTNYKFVKQPSHQELDYNLPLTLAELNIALNYRKGTALGFDNTSYPLIKNLPISSKKILLQLYNKIWTQGKIPDNWKIAKVIPILKPGKRRSSPDSYRPISLTSNICKTMESIINKRLQHYLEKNNIITHNQSGFRKGRTTIDQIVRLQHDIRRGQQRKHYTIAVFLDFSKAFDMVWHEGLLHKISHIKVKGAMINFINSFLQDRKIKVQIDKETSEPYQLQNGTPQGSIISPTLFNIMINDIFSKIPKQVKSSQFADDSAIWLTGPNLKKLTTTLQKTLNSIEQWTQTWGFTLSSQKTIGVVFRTARTQKAYPFLKINDKQIQIQNTAKFLGIIFDSTLSWTAHTNYMISRAKGDLNLLRSIAHSKWGCDKKTLLLIYQSLVKSKLEYGCQAWRDTAQSNINKINSIQYQSLKIITGAIHGTSLQSLLAETGELPLVIQWEHNTIKYISRNQHNTFMLELQLQNQSYGPQVRRRLEKRSIPLPFGDQASFLFHEYRLNNFQIQSDPYINKTPPSLIVQPETDLSLTTKINKSIPLPTDTTTSLEHLNNNYSNHFSIFTDGSKNQNGQTGYGIYDDQVKKHYSYKSPDNCSIYTAELLAIIKALELTLQYRELSAVILSDSLGSLQSIQNLNSKSRPDLLDNIISLLVTNKNQDNNITFVWIPSHIGIYGNERADLAAKEGTKLPHPNINNYTTAAELKGNIYRTSLKKHNVIWKEKSVNTWLYNVKPVITGNITMYSKVRKIDTCITRIMLGRCKIEHSLRKTGNNSNCTECKIRQDIDHIVLHCSIYKQKRLNLINFLRGKGWELLALTSILKKQDKSFIKELSTFIQRTKIYNVL